MVKPDLYTFGTFGRAISNACPMFLSSCGLFLRVVDLERHAQGPRQSVNG